MIKKLVFPKSSALSLVLLMLTQSSLFACDCIMTPIESHIKTTKNVVIAKVVKLLDTEKERDFYYYSEPDKSYRVYMEVETVYKGRLKKGQIIELGSTFSNCEIYFKNNEKYLLFLNKQDKKYFMRQCSYNEHTNQAEEDIEKIQHYKANRKRS